MRPSTLLRSLIVVVFLATPCGAAETLLDSLERRAREAVLRGQFSGAITQWKKVVDLSQRSGHLDRQVAALLRLGEVYFAQGELRQSREVLTEASLLAMPLHRPHLSAQINSALGCTMISRRAASEAAGGEKLLHEAVAELRKGAPDETIARAYNNLGASLARAGKHDEAIVNFREAESFARRADDPMLALQATANAALSSGYGQRTAEAITLAGSVCAQSKELPPSHQHAMAVLRAGTVFEILDGLPEGREGASRIQAAAAYRRAGEIGDSLGDNLVSSHALGARGRLYEAEGRFEDSLILTRRAIFYAQATRSPELLFRWNWQAGRLLRELGNLDAAIAAFQRGQTALQEIRHDVALHYGHPASGTSFRDVTGGLFFDLAELLLRRADKSSPVEAQRLLVAARDSAESLKSAELEDYFQDECVSLLRQKTTRLEPLSADSAVVYILPLRDRTETLVTIGETIYRYKSSAKGLQISAAATRLRLLLENRATNEYLEPAKELHDWLIAPLQPLLARSGIKTLVFVPDGALRTVPMGALHDGERFLIERYSIAITPGLTLLAPKPINRGGADVMLSGLSAARQDFPALPFVPEEISRLKGMFGGTPLLDEDFVLPRVRKEFATKQYNIVHFATHGHFDRDSANTFILTFDGKLTLDDLERLLQPSMLREAPVELLGLSACQTAAGDDRAALGLAGIAIKAGARSAFATLWYVNDQASARVVTDFYEELQRSPQLNKAQALQVAQKRLLSDPRYQHPCYWAPYLIIGNWL
jgi:CHAT domain-containing protein